MATFKIPKLARVGKVGHGKTTKHKGLDFLAATSKLTAHRKGSGATATGRVHGVKGIRAGLGLPAIRKGSSR
jgi:hypothetical protein